MVVTLLVTFFNSRCDPYGIAIHIYDDEKCEKVNKAQTKGAEISDEDAT